MSGSNATPLCTKGMSTLVRPKFAPGMLLQHEDLDQLSTYTRELNRLMFSSLFGCGVICGLVVKADQKCGQDAITVTKGLALDCAGDPIYVPKDQRVVIDENCAPNPNDELWVVLCAKVKCCAPRTSMCPSDEDEPESSCTRERDAFEICVVTDRPTCACSCVQEEEEEEGEGNGNEHESDCYCVDPTDPCYADHYDGKCGCDCDDCTGLGCCDCVILAKLTKVDNDGQISWTVDHSVRRFIRPVLMRDPEVARGRAAAAQPIVAAMVHNANAPGGTIVPANKTAVTTVKTKTPKPKV